MKSNGQSEWPKFSVNDGDGARAFVDRHGWVIFRDVFSSSEIESLRRMALQPKQIEHQGDILSNPAVPSEAFLLNPRIIEIARQLLQTRICYFGDSSISINGNILGFHKDNANRYDAGAPDWKSDYNLVRLGLYLQDHAEHSGGLSVRDQSHTTSDHSFGQPVCVPTRTGDVVVWKLTTTHSGEAVRFRWAKSAFVPIALAKLIRRRGLRTLGKAIFRPRQRNERIAFFATMAGEGRHLSNYLNYLKTRQYAVQSWRNSKLADERRKSASEAGLELIDMYDEARAANLDTLHEEYVAPVVRTTAL